ncbi:aquaporin [Amylostereum chailletii]|nr:aquaporin [Amylostereum chailletii]
MLLTLLGCGVNAQVTLNSSTAVSASPKGDYLSVSIIWAAGLALGVWVSGGISGGHCNPVVTLALAIFRDFSWKKVPWYLIGQFFGAWLGALLVYANYFHAIDLFEGGKGIRTTPGTASFFGVYTPDYLPAANAFFDEFIGTFILVLVIFAVTDKRNNPPPSGLVPLAIFVTLLGIAGAFGSQTGFALNPARDLGPRIMTSMVGYGHAVYNYRSQFWLWCPLLGPVAGGLTAAFIYDALLFVGAESWMNRRNASARRFHAQAVLTERENAPAGRMTDLALATGIV